MTYPIMPAALDHSKPITRAQYREWQSAMFDYQCAINSRKAVDAAAIETKKNRENAPDTDEEYDAFTLKRFQDQQAMIAEIKAASRRCEDDKKKLMASTPPSVEIMEKDQYTFLLQCQHWFGKSYVLDETVMTPFLPTYFSCRLLAPADSKLNKKAA